MRTVLRTSAALLLFALHAPAEESTSFDPFKLKAEYFDDEKVTNKLEFQEDGKEYRVRKLSSSRYLEIKHDGSWKKHGVYHEFYSSGKLSAKKNYVLGKLHGECTYYFTNGKVKRQYFYENGDRHGNWEERFEKAGTVWREGNYVKGMKQGMEKVYFPSGAIQFEKPYVDDKMHGTRVQYTESGKVFGREQFNRGEKVK